MERCEDMLEMKCRKCRTVLLVYPQTRVETSHGNLVKDYVAAGACSSEVWYIPEEHMPSWMTSNVEKGDWVKGKIVCPKCESRLGSYNFVSGMKCPCGEQVVAPIHIVKSKVDFFIPPHPPPVAVAVPEDLQLNLNHSTELSPSSPVHEC